jgi:putative transposase
LGWSAIVNHRINIAIYHNNKLILLLYCAIFILVNLFRITGEDRKVALLRFKEGCGVGRNTIYRLVKKNGWQVTNRLRTVKLRVKSSSSRTEYSDHRWAMDMTHIPCGTNGWGHFIAIIDCHER